MTPKPQRIEQLLGSAGDPTGLSVALLRGIDTIVRSRTSSRFAALYPAAMRTIAINDGAHITTAAHPSLHQFLHSLLHSSHRWLLFDTTRGEGRIMAVAAAQEILCNQVNARCDCAEPAASPRRGQ